MSCPPGSFPDCAGVCNGTSKLDCAGNCYDAATQDPPAYKDCAGVCEGTSVVDCNGTCYDPGNGEDPPYIKDCAGTCYDRTLPAPAKPGCDGVCNSGKVFDCAGVCDGSAVEDCAGTCNGSAVEDCSGTCGGTSVVDCAGICGGTSYRDCSGTCIEAACQPPNAARPRSAKIVGASRTSSGRKMRFAAPTSGRTVRMKPRNRFEKTPVAASVPLVANDPANHYSPVWRPPIRRPQVIRRQGKQKASFKQRVRPRAMSSKKQQTKTATRSANGRQIKIIY